MLSFDFCARLSPFPKTFAPTNPLRVFYIRKKVQLRNGLVFRQYCKIRVLHLDNFTF